MDDKPATDLTHVFDAELRYTLECSAVLEATRIE